MIHFFYVDYDLASKIPCSTSLHLRTPPELLTNIVVPMILCPQQKRPSLGASTLNKVDEGSDASSASSEDSFTTCSPIITTNPSPNVFHPSQLNHERAQDSNIRSIIS